MPEQIDVITKALIRELGISITPRALHDGGAEVTLTLTGQRTTFTITGSGRDWEGAVASLAVLLDEAADCPMKSTVGTSPPANPVGDKHGGR